MEPVVEKEGTGSVEEVAPVAPPSEAGANHVDAPAHEDSHVDHAKVKEESHHETIQHTFDSKGEKIYPSLYDTLPTTFGAILLGAIIIGSIQLLVKKIYEREKKEHKALTQFVTTMFACIVGIWIADKLIAGPSAQLLYEGESKEVLSFIKDITLMVFAYYFGTKANPNDDAGGES
jgi:hypothetical protein